MDTRIKIYFIFYLPKDGQFSSHCLPTSCGRSEEYVGVRVVEGVEYLTLDRVKVLKAKQLLIGRVLEGGDRKWLEVE